MILLRIFFGMLLLVSLANAAILESISVGGDEAKTQVQLKLSEKSSYKLFTLHNPERVIIDLNKTNIKLDLERIKTTKSVIKHVRKGHPHKNVTRLVFDVKQKVKVYTQKCEEKDARGPCLSFESLELHINPVKSMKSQTPRDIVVVIDPGHGGKDPGAQGARRNAEKIVVLQIARRLRDLVNKQPGMRAVLTRDGDYFVELRERLRIARKHNADVFVSIHADAFVNKNSRGASIFSLSQSGATSEAARWLAEKENHSELGGVDLSDLRDDSGFLRRVLIDLSQTATIRASLKMGERVLKHIDDLTQLHHDRVEQARFVVLKSPDIPSILVETGFISNPIEERNLINPAYQNKLTQAVFLGIKQYFADFPLHGTYIEKVASSKSHLVQRGESLYTISEKHHTTIAALTKRNKLKNTNVYVGERLILPESKT